MALAGKATAEGTARFAARFRDGLAPDGKAGASDAFRNGLGLTLSTVGYGTSAGEPTDEVDARYEAIVPQAIRSGCNFVDTAVSYRAQRSELALGRALSRMVAGGEVRRDELIIASKAGFIAHRLTRPSDPMQYVIENFIETGVARPDDLAGGIHCMTPDFLSQQLAWSLRNTDLRGLDVFLIQNPETQLAFVDRTAFRRRLQLAFARLEEEVAAGRIGCYGVATWEGFRRAPMASGYMSLEIMLNLVTDVAGAGHHFKCIQAPVNLGMLEAVTLRNQPVRNSILPFLSAARDLGITVVASAGLGQGSVPERTAEAMGEMFSGLPVQSQRSLQFVRSLPGVASVLFGSLDGRHVSENFEVLKAPADPERALRLAHFRGR